MNAVAGQDWLVGNRRATAQDRILDAASDLVSQNGFDALTIDALAARAHCSPATIYRNVGSRSAILEGVVGRLSARIVFHVREAITDLQGSERAVTALLVALEHIRAEPLGRVIMGSVGPDRHNGWLTNSPLVTDLAAEMLGQRASPLAAQWLLRITLALWYWPLTDRAAERELATLFIAPSLDAHLKQS